MHLGPDEVWEAKKRRRQASADPTNTDVTRAAPPLAPAVEAMARSLERQLMMVRHLRIEAEAQLWQGVDILDRSRTLSTLTRECPCLSGHMCVGVVLVERPWVAGS